MSTLMSKFIKAAKEVLSDRTKLFIFAAYVLAYYIGIAAICYHWRNPELTNMQVIQNLWEALTWK